MGEVLFDKSLSERVNAIKWYHKMALPGGIVTPGVMAIPPLEKYDVPEDLSGKRVLDVGAFDGLWTFEALRRGAAQVVAIDDGSDLPAVQGALSSQWDGFDLCREMLGYTDNEAQRYTVSVYDVDQFLDRQTFDVVLCFGVLYHLKHPFFALEKLRSMCTGEIYVETAISDDYSAYRGGIGHGYSGGHVVAEFYPRKQYGENHTNWWVPTLRCAAAWLSAAGFRNVTTRKLVSSPKELHQCRGMLRGEV